MDRRTNTGIRARAAAPTRGWLVVACAAAIALPGGCRTTPAAASVPIVGNVGATLVPPPPGAARIEPDRSQRFVYPLLVTTAPMPEYPPDLLQLRLEPVEVCLDVDIDEHGTVFDAQARLDASCPAPAGGEPRIFADAAVQAVRGWTYEPAYLCQAPDGFAGGDPCAAAGMVEHPTRLRLSYVFRFSQHDGQPVVERAD